MILFIIISLYLYIAGLILAWSCFPPSKLEDYLFLFGWYITVPVLLIYVKLKQ
jgi:hypothetical protein